MEPSLFVGLKINSAIQSTLKQVNAYKYSLLTGNGQYLQELTYEGSKYLGKYAELPASLESLENLQQNVQSLLNQLIPATLLGQQPLLFIVD